MPRIEISGIEINYRLLGKPGDPAVALNPGGRFSMEMGGLRELAEALAAGGRRVLLWDRPNCGASDLCFDGESESSLQGRVLVQLVRALELGPTAVGGGSAGSRTSLFAAMHDPQLISHLIPWWLSGGTISTLMLAANYFCESAIVAAEAGMEAVARLPAWAAQIAANPRNHDILLAQNPDRFIQVMDRWASAFVPSGASPVPGMTVDDFARLSMPVLIFRGSEKDIWHPAWVSEGVHKLIPHSRITNPPWPDEAPMQRLIAARRTGDSPFLDWPMLATPILEFTSD